MSTDQPVNPRIGWTTTDLAGGGVTIKPPTPEEVIQAHGLAGVRDPRPRLDKLARAGRLSRVEVEVLRMADLIP